MTCYVFQVHWIIEHFCTHQWETLRTAQVCKLSVSRVTIVFSDSNNYCYTHQIETLRAVTSVWVECPRLTTVFIVEWTLNTCENCLHQVRWWLWLLCSTKWQQFSLQARWNTLSIIQDILHWTYYIECYLSICRGCYKKKCCILCTTYQHPSSGPLDLHSWLSALHSPVTLCTWPFHLKSSSCAFGQCQWGKPSIPIRW